MLQHLNAALADRYAVERELGRGGMASVWLARDLRLGRTVAIKVLHPELAGAIGVDRFVREIRLTASLQHPHIVPVLDSGVVTGPQAVPLPWYAMAYVPGESLRARLQREQHLPVDEALRIIDEAAGALEAAHREGIVHRDIKPENLLLAGGHAYVADFGIAKALMDTGSERLTSTGLALGTPAYMSPEQAAGQSVDARTDQYSLASVLYEMLAGEPPFTGPTAQAIVARRLAEPARAIRPVRPSVSPGIEAALLRALERVPADRYPSVSAFADALRSAPASVATTVRPRGRQVVGGLVGALLLATLVLGAWLLGNRKPVAGFTRSPEVVALYRRGMRAYDQRTSASTGEAARDLRAAVQRDSTYADAWAGLAKTYVRAFERGMVIPGVPPDSLLGLALAAADRALAEGSSSADTWVTQAIVTRKIDPTDLAPAIRAARRALAIDSGSAPAWHVLALSLAESGDLDGALRDWRRSVTADPSYTQGLVFLSFGYYWRHQYDSATYWADSAIALDPSYLLARTTAGYAALERGKVARARAAFDAAIRLSTDVEALNALAGSAMTEARGGAGDEARALLRRAESLAVAYSPTPLHTAVYIAEAYAALGERDQAVAWLRRYTPVEDLHLQLHLRCDPGLEPLAADSRFRSLLLTPRPEGGRGC